MGAHTLGSMVKDNSGYAGVWILDEIHQFDTNYYYYMLNGESIDGGGECIWYTIVSAINEKSLAICCQFTQCFSC